MWTNVSPYFNLVFGHIHSWPSGRKQVWWYNLQNYQGPPAKKPKTDEEIKNRKLDYDKNTRVREFQPQWLKSFDRLEYHVVNGEGKMFCKICRKYESIGTFVSGSKTFKLESIKAHNSSNSHTKNNLKFQAKTEKPGTTSFS